MSETLRCVKGDQAVVIRAPGCSVTGVQYRVLLGREVAVLYRAYPPFVRDPTGVEHQVHPTLPSWLTQLNSPVNLPGTDGLGNVFAVASRFVCLADAYLMPIRPDPDPEETPTEEGVPCNAL